MPTYALNEVAESQLNAARRGAGIFTGVDRDFVRLDVLR